MKISRFHSQILNVPEDEPLAGAVEKEGSTRPIVILTLATDDGIEGIGVSFYGGALTRTLKDPVLATAEQVALALDLPLSGIVRAGSLRAAA